MKAVLFYGPQNIKYEETSIKPLEKGEILVKIDSALTCGTDVKTFRRGHPVLIKQIPSGFGHEFAGTVEKVAEGVTNVKPGDRVVCANSAPCGECFYCKRGEYNLCENLDLLNGAYAEYIVVPERIVKKNTFYCAEFVRYILKRSRINTKGLPKIIKPQDFSKLQGLNQIYEGKLQEYKYYLESENAINLVAQEQEI